MTGVQTCALPICPVDFATLNRLAMDHADAILQVTDDIDPELLEYARKTGKPFLSIAGEENRKEILSDFYRTLIGEEEE